MSQFITSKCPRPAGVGSVADFMPKSPVGWLVFAGTLVVAGLRVVEAVVVGKNILKARRRRRAAARRR